MLSEVYILSVALVRVLLGFVGVFKAALASVQAILSC